MNIICQCTEVCDTEMLLYAEILLKKFMLVCKMIHIVHIGLPVCELIKEKVITCN
jgi:hypothetical protein